MSDQRFGMYDTVDGLWMSTNDAGDGPRLYDDLTLARIASQVLCVAIGWPEGRVRAAAYGDGAVRQRDEVGLRMTPLRALQKIERGTV